MGCLLNYRCKRKAVFEFLGQITRKLQSQCLFCSESSCPGLLSERKLPTLLYSSISCLQHFRIRTVTGRSPFNVPMKLLCSLQTFL